MKAVKRMTVLLSAVMVLVAFSPAFGQDGIVHVDQIDGLSGDMCFNSGATLKFHVRFTNNTGQPIAGLTNCFKFSSANLTWEGITKQANPNYNWMSFFDLGGLVINVYDEGPGNWYVGVGGVSLYSPGMPVGFDDIAFTMDVGPINGEGEFVLDTAFHTPAYYWLWGWKDGTRLYPEWDGAMTFTTDCPIPDTVEVYHDPYPIHLKDLGDRIVYVHIKNENNAQVDPATIRVHGKIPPYTPADYPAIEDGEYVTDCFVFRFLSAYRPIPETVQSTFIVTYSFFDGSYFERTGHARIEVPAADVTLDGYVNQEDVDFMRDYLLNNGKVSELEEMMDVNRDGQVDILDLNAITKAIE